MVITANDLRESTCKLLELISEFSKILAYSINLKTQLYFYILAISKFKFYFCVLIIFTFN